MSQPLHPGAVEIDPVQQRGPGHHRRRGERPQTGDNTDQQSQQQNKSSMNQNDAEQKLKLLQEKERKLQERLHKQSKEKGGSHSRDW